MLVNSHEHAVEVFGPFLVRTFPAREVMPGARKAWGVDWPDGVTSLYYEKPHAEIVAKGSGAKVTEWQEVGEVKL